MAEAVNRWLAKYDRYARDAGRVLSKRLSLVPEARADGPARAGLVLSGFDTLLFAGTLHQPEHVREWVGQLAGLPELAVRLDAPEDVAPVMLWLPAVLLLIRGYGVPVSPDADAMLERWHFPELAVAPPVDRRTILYFMGVFDPRMAKAHVGLDPAQRFVAGATFGADPQARLRHLLLACEVGAGMDEVRPAVNEFLDLQDDLEQANASSWKMVVFLMYIWLVKIGRVPPGEFSMAMHDAIQRRALE